MTEDAQVLKADLVRETELRREAERRVQRLQAALDLKPYPDDLDNAERDVQALIGYVQHTSSCESRTDDQVGEAWKRGCTCGLSALLSLLERRAKPTLAACSNCGHSDLHDGPSGDVNDACTHPGCRCGYYTPVERRGPAEKDKSEKVTRGDDSGAPLAPTGSIAASNETATRIVSYTYACGCRTTGVYNERCGLHGLEALSKANAKGR